MISAQEDAVKRIVVGWLALSAFALWAQIETARIAGTVTDSQGAAIVNARVIIANTDTGVVFETATTVNGHYESVPLRIGRYRVTVEAPGFKRSIRDGITLQVQQTATVDFQLELGQLQQEVSVTAFGGRRTYSPPLRRQRDS